jgi:hypothetical protein
MAQGSESGGGFGKGGLRRLLALRRTLVDADRAQDVDAEAPKSVMFDDRSRALLDRALELALEGREDPDAVHELVRMAGRHGHALQVAALGARQFGAHHDHPIPNRAHRLLQAALTGGPVQPPTAEDQARIAIFKAFWAGDPEQQWVELTTREPRLVELADDVRAGQFGPSRGVPTTAPASDEERSEALELLGQERNLRDRLAALIGPTSRQTEVLLASQAAQNAAWLYLDRLRG